MAAARLGQEYFATLLDTGMSYHSRTPHRSGLQTTSLSRSGQSRVIWALRQFPSKTPFPSKFHPRASEFEAGFRFHQLATSASKHVIEVQFQVTTVEAGITRSDDSKSRSPDDADFVSDNCRQTVQPQIRLWEGVGQWCL